MTKVEELRTRVQNVREKPVIQQVLNQLSCIVQLPQVDLGATGRRLDTGRVLGLQLSSPVWLLATCVVTAMVERTAYLDLCLIFLLLRFSLENYDSKTVSHFF